MGEADTSGAKPILQNKLLEHGQKAVASSAVAVTEVRTVTINKYLVTALPGLTSHSQS
jgi:hypothetical protein